MTYYKALNAQGRSCHGGTLQWSLPRYDAKRDTWTPGDWMPKIDGEIEACERGYHAAKSEQQLLHWLHERIYVIESRAPWVDAHGKVVTAGPVRLIAGTAWDDCTARLFAVSCALDVLPIYEKAYPDDPRVADAITVAWERAYGFGTSEEWAAAGDAAWAAARDAAGDDAGDAAWGAARDAAWGAARDAARAAAWGAARAAAWGAAWTAAGAMQTARLKRWLAEGPDL